MGNIIVNIIITYCEPIFLVFTAFLLDVIIGDPRFLPHPVRFMGHLIAGSERVLYIDSDPKVQMRRGALLFLINISLPLIFFGLLLFVSGFHPIPRFILSIILCTYCIAASDLRKSAMKVMKQCERGDLPEARRALSMIVGRDTEKLDLAGIVRGAVESVAESTSDGVVAPIFYMMLFGPLGGILYKSVNTMDSMIGYHNDKYEYFGRVAAKADDIFNFLPARASALCVIIAGGILHLDNNAGFRIWKRDRRKHSSPNSAQCESAMAGLLGIRLGGDATYGGVLTKKPYIGDDGRPPEAQDIARSCKVMYLASAIFLILASIIRLAVLLIAGYFLYR